MSVFQDTLNLITFHVHCFYAYARRIFVSQSSGLLSLWRLFRGKKYNPLRDRVDSSPNNVDQVIRNFWNDHRISNAKKETDN